MESTGVARALVVFYDDKTKGAQFALHLAWQFKQITQLVKANLNTSLMALHSCAPPECSKTRLANTCKLTVHILSQINVSQLQGQAWQQPPFWRSPRHSRHDCCNISARAVGASFMLKCCTTHGIGARVPDMSTRKSRAW